MTTTPTGERTMEELATSIRTRMQDYGVTDPEPRTDGAIVGQLPACPAWCVQHDNDGSTIEYRQRLDVPRIEVTSEHGKVEVLTIDVEQYDVIEDDGRIVREPMRVMVSLEEPPQDDSGRIRRGMTLIETTHVGLLADLSDALKVADGFVRSLVEDAAEDEVDEPTSPHEPVPVTEWASEPIGDDEV